MHPSLRGGGGHRLHTTLAGFNVGLVSGGRWQRKRYICTRWLAIGGADDLDTCYMPFLLFAALHRAAVSPSLPYDLEEVGSPPWCSILRSSPLSPCALRIRSDVLGLAMASVHRRPSPALCPTPLLLRDGSEASSAVSSRPSIHDIRPIGLVSSSSATSATARRSPQEVAEPACSQAATVFIRHPPRFRVSQ